MYNLVSDVAPYLGAWIEIVAEELYYTVSRVAPYLGAWIEISVVGLIIACIGSSHPTWVRGLKLMTYY